MLRKVQEETQKLIAAAERATNSSLAKARNTGTASTHPRAMGEEEEKKGREERDSTAANRQNIMNYISTMRKREDKLKRVQTVVDGHLAEEAKLSSDLQIRTNRGSTRLLQNSRAAGESAAGGASRQQESVRQTQIGGHLVGRRSGG